MKTLYYLIIISSISLAISTNARSESNNAAENWNNSSGWKSAYEKLVMLEQADKIEKAKGGFYDGFESYTYYISSTTVGNLVTISNSEIRSVNTINCGNVVSQNHLTGEGTNTTKVHSSTCANGGKK